MNENEIGEILLGCAIKVHIDVLVASLVVVELKVAERILPLHSAQLLSYLKLSGKRLGYLLNFNVVHMRQGIKRVVNHL